MREKMEWKIEDKEKKSRRVERRTRRGGGYCKREGIEEEEDRRKGLEEEEYRRKQSRYRQLER